MQIDKKRTFQFSSWFYNDFLIIGGSLYFRYCPPWIFLMVFLGCWEQYIFAGECTSSISIPDLIKLLNKNKKTPLYFYLTIKFQLKIKFLKYLNYFHSQTYAWCNFFKFGKVWSVLNKLKHFLLFHDGGPYRTKTRPLICTANQWTGLHIIGTSIVIVLKTFFSTCQHSKKSNGSGLVLLSTSQTIYQTIDVT